MTLVDTSVMIDGLRRPDPRMQSLFASAQVALCGVTRAEVLHGARDAAELQRLNASLDAFPQVPFPEHFWAAAGANLYALRSAGISVPFADALIATVALENDLELWTRDNQFHLIRKVLPALKLFQEPP